MKETIQDLNDLFFDQLRDIHDVELQVAETLPHLADLATLPALRELFLAQRPFTLEQQQRVAGIFERHSRAIGSDKCRAMEGLIKGGNEHLGRAKDTTVRDFLLVAHWIRIKYYEIAAYQIAATLSLHLDEVADRQILSDYLAAEQRAGKELEAAASELFPVKSGEPITPEPKRAVL